MEPSQYEVLRRQWHNAQSVLEIGANVTPLLSARENHLHVVYTVRYCGAVAESCHGGAAAIGVT